MSARLHGRPAGQPDASSLQVLYIAGFGRSGSTLLGNIVGSADGLFSTGELHLLWTALAKGSGCGCGERVDRCPVWSAVLDRLASDRGAAPDPAEVREWQLAEARVVHTPRLLKLAGRGDSGRPTLDRYAGLMGDLYRAIASVTGARVIVDASKTTADAAILPRVDAIDPAWVHLVRDPRAVAVSQARARPTLDAHRETEMHRRGVIESAARWVTANRLTGRLRAAHPGRSTLLRYEDFAAAPRDAVSGLLDLVGAPRDAVSFTDDRTVVLGDNHTVWGNRSRFTSGEVQIKPDEGWRGASRLTLATTTLLTAPWLGRYGYPLWPSPVRS